MKREKDKKLGNVIDLSKAKQEKTDADRAADIFAESIKEEIQQENLQRLWEKYGTLAISVVAGALVVFGVYNMWQKNDLEKREAVSVRFTSAQNLLADGLTDRALGELKGLLSVDSKSYALLAKMESAALLASKGDLKSLNTYQSIFKDPKADKLLSNLAYIYYVNTALDLMNSKTLEQELKKMIGTISSKEYQEGPWKLLAKQSLAFCYMKEGNNQEAKKVLEDLAKMEEIPNNMAEQTRMLIQSLED